MASRRVVYPDISDILARKQRGRERLASLPFGEKIKLLETMRARDDMMRKGRDRRLEKPEKGR
jgi:hypothetical protein